MSTGLAAPYLGTGGPFQGTRWRTPLPCEHQGKRREAVSLIGRIVQMRGSHPPSWPVVIPIEDTLDLHIFHPRDIPSLIPEYLDLCRRKGILQVRLIHGKGKGVLRERVHAILSGLEWVSGFSLADRLGGDWGATIVTLRPSGH